MASFFSSRAKPVAITVTRTSSFNVGSITAPKMISASSLAASVINVEASLTSYNERSDPPVTLIIIPVAPSILIFSNNGEDIA